MIRYTAVSFFGTNLQREDRGVLTRERWYVIRYTAVSFFGTNLQREDRGVLTRALVRDLVLIKSDVISY